MPYRKICSVLLSFVFIFSQFSWASVVPSDVCQPVAFIGMKVEKNGLFFLLDKKAKGKDRDLNVKEELSFFFTALVVPEKNWWVNLDLLVDVPSAIGYGLAYTDLGRVLMNADVNLKRIATQLIGEDPRLSQVLLEKADNQNLDLGALRLWIEPDKIKVVKGEDTILLKEATLKVKAEIKGDNYRLKQVINKIIVPKITKIVNFSDEFAPLRSAYNALILAACYKKYFKDKVVSIAKLIDSYITSGLLSSYWTPRDYIGGYNRLYLRAALKTDEFFTISSGGFKGTDIASTMQEKENPAVNITDKDQVENLVGKKDTGLINIGLDGLAKKSYPLRIVGEAVDITGLRQGDGPLAIVSDAKDKVRLKDLIDKDGKELTAVSHSNEIIWIKADKKVEIIKPPIEGERGVFIDKDKAIVINSKGQVFERTYPTEELVSFGTSGWRFTLPQSPQEKEKLMITMENALEGFADYYQDHIKEVQEQYGTDRVGVVVVRDSRKLGDEFVEKAKDVLLRRGIDVYVMDSKEVLPTPLAAFATNFYTYKYQTMDKEGRIVEKEIKPAFAINFTASHNPPNWSGFKVTPADGGAAEDKITSEIGKRINERIVGISVRAGQSSPSKAMVIDLSKERLVRSYSGYVVDVLDNLFGAENLVYLLQNVKDLGIKIVPTGLHGAGGQILWRVLKDIFGEDNLYKAGPKTLKLDPLSDFGGLPRPEPNEENTEFLRSMILENGSPTIGVALDGDADRFAIRDTNGNYVTPNQLIALIVYFLNDIGIRKGVVKTVPTSNLATGVADYFGVDGAEMKVGFKWAKKFWNDERFGVIGEESAHIGLAGTQTYDDGILMGIFSVLMAGYFQKKYKKSLSEMVDFIQEEELHNFFIYKRENVNLTPSLKNFVSDLLSIASQRADKDREIKDPRLMLDFINWESIEKELGDKIDKVILIDGIKFVFKSGSWFLIRLSGTEPVARLYVEGIAKTKEKAEQMKRKLLAVGGTLLKGNFIVGENQNSNNDSLSKLAQIAIVSSVALAMGLLPISSAWAGVGQISSVNWFEVLGILGVVGLSGWMLYRTVEFLSKRQDIDYLLKSLQSDLEGALWASARPAGAGEWSKVVSKISEHCPAFANYLAARLVLEGIPVEFPAGLSADVVVRNYDDRKVASKLLDMIKTKMSSYPELKDFVLFDSKFADDFSNLFENERDIWGDESLIFYSIVNTEEGSFLAWKRGISEALIHKELDEPTFNWLVDFLTELDKRKPDLDAIKEMLKQRLSLTSISEDNQRVEMFDSALGELLNSDVFKKADLKIRTIGLAIFLKKWNVPTILEDVALLMMLNTMGFEHTSVDKLVSFTSFGPTAFASKFFVNKAYEVKGGRKPFVYKVPEGLELSQKGPNSAGGINWSAISINYIW